MSSLLQPGTDVHINGAVHARWQGCLYTVLQGYSKVTNASIGVHLIFKEVVTGLSFEQEQEINRVQVYKRKPSDSSTYSI